MSDVGFQLSGTDPMIKRIARLARAFGLKVEKSLKEEADEIMTTSKNDFVPVDEGELRESGQVQQKRNGASVTVILSYGNDDIPYAVAVHEHLSEASPPSWRNTVVRFGPGNRGPKYLEIPLMEAAPKLPKSLARKLTL
jgi:hypothetical protein